MNRVILIGRLTKEPDIKIVGAGINKASFTLAVDRNYKTESGERQADFINCVAWRATADLIAKYIHKGNLLGVEGQIQTNSYDDQQSGERKIWTQVLVEQIHFLEKKQDNGAQNVNPFANMDAPQPYNQGYGNQQRNSYNGGNYNNYQQNSFPQNNYQQNNYQQKPEQKQSNPFGDISGQFNITDDDLPF